MRDFWERCHFRSTIGRFMMRFFLLLAFVGSGATLRRKSKGGRANWRSHFRNYFETTAMETTCPEGITPACRPYISDPRGESRGLVILQHGFTACAGFWKLMAEPLVEKGWTVMVPNLPGAGRAQKVVKQGSGYTVTDWTDDFPVWGDEYEEFSQELMEVIQEYKDANPSKELVIVGCSHGGAVATYVAMRMDPETFSRVLLMNPFLSPPTGLGMDYGISFLRDMVPKLLPLLKPFAGVGPIGEDGLLTWGDDCNHVKWPTDPRNKGRTGGQCQFSLESFRGVLEFANLVEGEARMKAANLGVFTGGVVDRLEGVEQAAEQLRWNIDKSAWKSPPQNLRVQITTTENDGAISNARVHFAAEALHVAVAEGQSSMCAMAEDLTHTYINPTDKPVGTDFWWLDASRVTVGKTALDMLVDFASEGVFVPTKGSVTVDEWLVGDARCDVNKKR